MTQGDALPDLFREEAGKLFAEAIRVGRTRPIRLVTPVFLNTICRPQVMCKHCPWAARIKMDPNFARAFPQAEVVKKAQEAVQAGAHRIDVSSGWIGYFHLPDDFVDCVAEVKNKIASSVFGHFGPVSIEGLKRLKQAGADGYWCGIEVPNRDLFRELRPGDDFDARVATLRQAKEIGLPTGTGFFFGMGETDVDLAGGLRLMRDLDVDSVTVMPFRPWPHTEMEDRDPPNPARWARMVAITRLYLPNADVLVPADFAHWGTRAGANGFDPFYGSLAGWGIDGEGLKRLRSQALASA